jgi:hypothetical protein
MVRIARLGLVFTLSLIGPASASASGTGYTAVLQSPGTADRLVAHGLMWRCVREHCVAPAANSRTVVICQALSRKAGTVLRFSRDGDPLAPALLERCNGRPDDVQAVATQ